MQRVAALVQRTITRRKLIPPGARVIVALSGGPDSVAMAHLLADLARPMGFALVGLAHLNHSIRGVDADHDEGFCREVAAALGLPIDVERANVPAIAAASRRSLEDAGRVERYAFLGRAAERAQADLVAVGHTLDDQAETVLLQLVRGAGPRGLAGIHPRAGIVVRPLIETRRKALRDYLVRNGVAFVEDASNRDLSNPRNRVRHELVPLLEKDFNPAIVRVLAREAEIARVDADYMDGEARSAWDRLVTVSGDMLEIDAVGLLEAPPAVSWRVARAAIQRAGSGTFVGFDLVQRLLVLAANPGASGMQLPGASAGWRGGRLSLVPGRSEATVGQGTNFPPIPLSITGEAVIPGTGRVVTARLVKWPEPANRTARALRCEPDTAVVDAEGLWPWLYVRTRRSGDSFRPLGMTGRKKLQDFFVDRKVPRPERERTPLVVDRNDRIVWVAGHIIAEDFRVTARTEAVVILKMQDQMEPA
ncbi:MAG: tRNA lysidine(34) synthetase TilS [Vicinamibacterales bacterium]